MHFFEKKRLWSTLDFQVHAKVCFEKCARKIGKTEFNFFVRVKFLKGQSFCQTEKLKNDL